MVVIRKIVFIARSSLKASNSLVIGLFSRFWRLSRPIRLVGFMVAFALMGGVYALVVNYAATEEYGDIPTASDELVMQYETPHDHALLPPDDITTTEPMHGILLYGNGLMLCGDLDISLAHKTKTKEPNFRKLTNAQVKQLYAKVRSLGFDDLYNRTPPNTPAPPIGAEPSVMLNSSVGSRTVTMHFGETSPQYDAIIKYLTDECAKATEEYKSDEVNVYTLKTEEAGSSLPEIPTELEPTEGGEVGRSTARSLDKEAGKKVKSKTAYGVRKYKGKDGKAVQVNVTQLIPSYQATISEKTRTRDSKGKVSAADIFKVRLLYVVAKGQARPPTAQARLDDIAATLPSYYYEQTQRTFTYSEPPRVVGGNKTADEYRQCPSTSFSPPRLYDCNGSQALASFYNLENEFGNASFAITIIIYGWDVGVCLSLGNSDIATVPEPSCTYAANQPGFTQNIQRFLVAHEAGHSFGLGHTCERPPAPGTLMFDNDKARNCSVPPGFYSTGAGYVPLDANQAAVLRDHSPYFNSNVAPPPKDCPVSNAIAVASRSDGLGYWFVNSVGWVDVCGIVTHYGDLRMHPFNGDPIVGIAALPSGKGYWLATAKGAVYPFGDAQYKGGANGAPLNKPIVGIAAHPTNGGYWLVASDGGIFNYGTSFFGSTGALKLNQPIIGMASTPLGNGYWLAASDGGVFSFGDAKFQGSTGAIRLNLPIVAIVSHPYGSGYWLVGKDGGVFAFGSSKFYGSPAGTSQPYPMIGMLVGPDGRGYTVINMKGGRFDYGSATGNPRPIEIDQGLTPTFQTTMSWNTAWPQYRNPTGVQMTFHTAWDGGVLPGHCVQIQEPAEPWESTWSDNQLCSNIDLGFGYTAGWPADQPVPGNCVRIDEPGDPYTWNDNVICTHKVDIGLRWSNNGSLADANTTCVNMYESSDGHAYWADNYLCWNTYWPGSTLDPLPAGCVFINEPAEPWQETWGDNALCASPDIGLSYTSAWPPNQPVSPNCVNIVEPGDSSTWADNVLCSSTYVGLHWSYDGNTDSEDTDCILMNEPSDLDHWADNYLCWYVPPPGQPDLVVTDLTWTPASPQTNNQMTFSAVIKNQGTAATPAGVTHGISWRVDGQVVGDNATSTASLAPGASRTLTANSAGPLNNGTWIATTGNHTVEAFVDDVNRITNEIYEDNNKFVKNLDINVAPVQPDLKVTDITWTPAAPQSGNQVTFSATIKNIGTGHTPEGVVHGIAFKVDGTQVSSSVGNSASLAPGASRTQVADIGQFTHTWTATSGSHTIEATVDANNLITNELNETNNKFSKTLVTNAPPSIPGNLRTTGVTYNSIALAWNASTDDKAVNHYRIYRNGALYTYTNLLTYTDSGVTASTNYTYQVSAIDHDGGESAKSSPPLSVTTLPVTDTQAPNAPTLLSGTAAGANQVNLSWYAPADNPNPGGSGVKGYRIYRATGTTPPPTTGTPVMDLPSTARGGTLITWGQTGLANNTTYTYLVTAYDAAGNTSRATNPALTIKTLIRRFLSDLSYVPVTNGYGPVQKDRSNGESGATDGNTLTLNGTTYLKGLGTHSRSEITYAASGKCAIFAAKVGIDDEVGPAGSVIFQVWADNVKRYDSGLMTGSTATKGVNVNILGAQELKLVVTNGGDGNSQDHGDWANATVECS